MLVQFRLLQAAHSQTNFQNAHGTCFLLPVIASLQAVSKTALGQVTVFPAYVTAFFV